MLLLGNCGTKNTILKIYEEITEAMKTGKPYQTRLDSTLDIAKLQPHRDTPGGT